MSTSKSTNTINGCAFCRSKRMHWVGHSANNCKALKENICEHCQQKGHTISRCPVKFEEIKQVRERERRQRWEENEKVRQQEKAREVEANVKAKAKSWAGIAAKSVPAELAAKIAEEDRILKEQSEAKRAAEAVKRAEEATKLAVEKKERWERNYVDRMSDQYGLKDGFLITPKNHWETTICVARGEFWYFKVEGTKNDHEIAKKLREDTNNQTVFHAYLEEKYFVNWLNASERTEDDCTYLVELRYKKEIEEENEYYERLEKEREWVREWEEQREKEEKEREEMADKLARGEISQKVYTAWEMEKKQEEWDEEDDYHLDGLRIYEEQYQYAKREAEWKARKAAREKK